MWGLLRAGVSSIICFTSVLHFNPLLPELRKKYIFFYVILFRMGRKIYLIFLQPFLHFNYITTHSPTLPSLYLRHSSFFNPSFASPTSQALHLIHLASRPWKEPLWRASIPGIYRIPSCFTYVTVHSPSLLSLLLRHKLFT